MTKTMNRCFFIYLALALIASAAVAGGQCKKLQESTPEDLRIFLLAAAPSVDDPNCIVFAVRALGNQRYVPAAEVLSSLLDFRRPKTDEEKHGLYIRPQGIAQLYPAAYALEMIGEKTLPVVLRVIKSSSTSPVARENAVFVWMAIQRDSAPGAVSALMQEAARTPDSVSRQNLEWAASRALIWCNPPDEAQCKAALSGLGGRGK
jgi:hypothetical protein